MAPAGAETRAQTRAGELGFLAADDIAAATAQAAGLGAFHLTGPYSAEDHLAEAARQEAQGDPLRASDFVGAALSREDTPANWESYARLLLAAAPDHPDDRDAILARAISAAINGTLRADAPALRRTLASDMGQRAGAVGPRGGRGERLPPGAVAPAARRHGSTSRQGGGEIRLPRHRQRRAVRQRPAADLRHLLGRPSARGGGLAALRATARRRPDGGEVGHAPALRRGGGVRDAATRSPSARASRPRTGRRR